MFWGLILEPQRRYSQVVKKSFHISKASLDIFAASDKPCQVMLTSQERNYLLCTLQKDVNLQCDLDLNFAEGEEVVFATNGSSNIHLTGYLFEDIADDDNSSETEESESSAESVENFETYDKKRKLKFNQEQPTKKSKTEELLDEVKYDYNSEEDPTFDMDEQDLESDVEEDIEEEEEDEELEDINNLSTEAAYLNGSGKKQPRKAAQKLLKSFKNLNASASTAEAGSDESDAEADSGESTDEEDSPVKELPKPKLNGVSKAKKEKPKNDKQKQKKEETPQKSSDNKKNKGSNKVRQVEGGMTIQDLQEGDGKPIQDGKMAHVYYVGRLKSNNKIIDSCSKGQPFKFRLGKKEVIKAWDIGLIGMKVGGKRRIVTPPQMAYGAQGAPPAVPPNAALVFDIELRNFS